MTFLKQPVASRNAAAAAALFASLALGLVACSGDSGGGAKDAGSGGGDTVKTEEDQALEHRECLREQGLDIPEPKTDGEGTTLELGGSEAEVEKAFKACQDKAVGGGPKELTQAEKDKQLAFARCMRENGIDMPDPTFEGGAMQAAPMVEEKDMKKFEKANKTCESAGR
ncbi:hypothetical protein [Streptomyces sp. NBC_01508]|uniref:hypothetical protein n=1 Tax=Streptomyces sp. NBC_01508 TaxID=2903888 RepID=UPI00386E09EF